MVRLGLIYVQVQGSNPVESEVLLTTQESTPWLLDSGTSYQGTSYHVTPHRSQFQQYSDRHSDSVRVGNSQRCAIIGIGIVELNLPGGSTLVLHNVRHVLELSRPLIKVGQLDEDGIRAGFSSGGSMLHKRNLLLAQGPKVHSLYPLYVTLREGDIFFIDIPCHRYGTDDSDISARPAPRTFPEPVTSPNSPSRITNSSNISCTTNR